MAARCIDESHPIATNGQCFSSKYASPDRIRVLLDLPGFKLLNDVFLGWLFLFGQIRGSVQVIVKRWGI